jgi:hypothetical protein
MSIVGALQQARKARLQRIAARAVTPAASPTQVAPAFAGHGSDDPAYERAWAIALLGIVPPAIRRRSKPSIGDIQRATEQHFGLEPGSLAAHDMTRVTAQRRQIAMYLTRELTAKSYPEIARCFGGRTHGTALRAVRKIEDELASDDELAANLDGIRAALASPERWL